MIMICASSLPEKMAGGTMKEPAVKQSRQFFIVR
jgi:hypothetical protein